MVDCLFVTCDHVPALDPDDRIMLDELRRRGISVSVGVWSDPDVDWSAARLCVIRSTWDYHARFREFMAWVDRVAAVTTTRNDPKLLRWSADKSYLSRIASAGVPIVPMVCVPRGRTQSLADLSAALGRRDVVIKPSRGAAAHDVLLVRNAAESQHGQAHLDRLVRSQDVLVQPYLESVASYGERALVFFHGRFSHAVVKKPFDTLLVVSGARSAVVEATDDEIAVAMRAIAAIPGAPLYARIDLLRGDGGETYVSEVELVEPALYLAVHDPAQIAFADAIGRELDAASRTRTHVLTPKTITS